MGLRIGIDLGGTKIEIAALDEAGSIVERIRVATPDGDYDAILRVIFDLVNGVVEGRHGSKAGIFVFWSRDILLSTPARRSWVEPDLAPLSVGTLAAAVFT